MLYIHVIQNYTQTVSPQGYSRCLQAGEQAQRDLATCGSTSSFAERYVVILEELRKEAQESIRRRQHKSNEHLSLSQSIQAVSDIAMAETEKSSGPSNHADYQYAGCRGIESSLPQAFGGLVDHQQSLNISEVPFESQDWMGDLMEDTSPASYIADLTS